jgi:DNA-binding PadR family transcriptional regulator
MAAAVSDFEFMILLAVLRLQDEAYGVPIGRELERVAKRTSTRAALYTALGRLEHRQLLTSFLGEPTAERGGRAKRYFQVTTKGLQAVRHTQRAFVALWSSIPELQGAG